MTNPAQYQDKIQAYTDGKDPLAMQHDAPGTIAELIAGIPEAALRQRPFPNKWSSASRQPWEPDRQGSSCGF